MNVVIEPSLSEFRQQAADRRVISVRARLLADGLTAVGAYRQLCGTRTDTFLFESAESGVWSRWSFVGVHSPATLIGSRADTQWDGRHIAGLPTAGRPLDVLRETLDLLHTVRDPALPPFTSGMVGYLGYDMVRAVEPTVPDSGIDDLGLPDMVMMIAGDLAVLDHHRGEIWLIANAINFDASPERVDEAYAAAVDRVRAMVAALSAPSASMLASHGDVPEVTVLRSEGTTGFERLVEAAKEEIVAGEIFQVVPSQRFTVPTQADPLAIYRELRITNPSPYLFLLRLPGFSIVGSSPEALVTVHEGLAVTHPIAGTRPRGSSPSLDQQLEAELLADEKERAEHLMLVDLGRNDLGRVCKPGTVQVTEFMQVRRYSHVMHLEAEVRGEVQDGVSALDVTMACFPAGTLSGSPKVRAMQIIDRLETYRRGPYGGVVGYFDFAGDADAAITIRSAIIKDGKAYVQAGAGVVADSVPHNENLECQDKAMAMIASVRRAAALQPAQADDQQLTLRKDLT